MRRKIAIAVTICGFATAVLSLAAAFVDYRNRNDEERRMLILQAQNAEAQARAAEAEARAAQETASKLAAIQRQQEQHRAACNQNLAILATAETDFAGLQQRHGTFLQNIKSCVVDNSDDDSRKKCQAAMCIGFDFLYRNTGKSCAGTLLERDNIVRQISQIRGALVADQCNPPSSPALEFMNY